MRDEIHTQVRPLTPLDAEAYFAMRREMLLDSPWAFGSSPEDDRAQSPADVVEVLRGPEHAIVGGFTGDALVASAGVYRERKLKARHLATIWGVYTRPNARGQGLGERVVRGAIDIARSWAGVRAVQLSVSERGGAARRLYERLGFVAWGLEPGCTCVDGAYIGEVHMQLRVSE